MVALDGLACKGDAPVSTEARFRAKQPGYSRAFTTARGTMAFIFLQLRRNSGGWLTRRTSML
jgi:hypothetical protein